jgi:hypothetical protein
LSDEDESLIEKFDKLKNIQKDKASELAGMGYVESVTQDRIKKLGTVRE